MWNVENSRKPLFRIGFLGFLVLMASGCGAPPASYYSSKRPMMLGDAGYPVPADGQTNTTTTAAPKP